MTPSSAYPKKSQILIANYKIINPKQKKITKQECIHEYLKFFLQNTKYFLQNKKEFLQNRKCILRYNKFLLKNNNTSYKTKNNSYEIKVHRK